jgi:hypothetical protein
MAIQELGSKNCKLQVKNEHIKIIDMKYEDGKHFYKEVLRFPVKSTQSKHFPQNMTGEKAERLESLAASVGYAFPKIGVYQGLSQEEDVFRVQRLASLTTLRPVKFVITKDSRIWADNTHWMLACLLKMGIDIIIEDTPHYIIDFRTNPLTIFNRPSTLVMPYLSVSIQNALRLQDMIDRGWRPLDISFTIGDLLTIGKYQHVFVKFP